MISTSFLPRDAVHNADCAVARCLSVTVRFIRNVVIHALSRVLFLLFDKSFIVAVRGYATDYDLWTGGTVVLLRSVMLAAQCVSRPPCV